MQVLVVAETRDTQHATEMITAMRNKYSQLTVMGVFDAVEAVMTTSNVAPNEDETEDRNGGSEAGSESDSRRSSYIEDTQGSKIVFAMQAAENTKVDRMASTLEARVGLPSPRN